MFNTSFFTAAFVKNPLICFRCCPWNPLNLSQSFHLKASRRVSSFFLSVQLSQPYVATGILALLIVVFSLKSVRCDFLIFSAVMPRSPALGLTWYTPSYTHHLLSSGTQGTGTYPPAPVVHSEWVHDAIDGCGLFTAKTLDFRFSCRGQWLLRQKLRAKLELRSVNSLTPSR